jgi:hypothetical protein
LINIRASGFAQKTWRTGPLTRLIVVINTKRHKPLLFTCVYGDTGAPPAFLPYMGPRTEILVILGNEKPGRT